MTSTSTLLDYFIPTFFQYPLACKGARSLLQIIWDICFRFLIFTILLKLSYFYFLTRVSLALHFLVSNAKAFLFLISFTFLNHRQRFFFLYIYLYFQPNKWKGSPFPWPVEEGDLFIIKKIYSSFSVFTVLTLKAIACTLGWGIRWVLGFGGFWFGVIFWDFSVWWYLRLVIFKDLPLCSERKFVQKRSFFLQWKRRLRKKGNFWIPESILKNPSFPIISVVWNS